MICEYSLVAVIRFFFFFFFFSASHGLVLSNATI